MRTSGSALTRGPSALSILAGGNSASTMQRAGLMPPPLPVFSHVARLHGRFLAMFLGAAGLRGGVSRLNGRSIPVFTSHVAASAFPSGWLHCAVPSHQCPAAAFWRGMAA